MELTDLDKLYLALAETGQDCVFNMLYYFLNITSIKALKEYNPIGNNYENILQPNDFNTMKYNICDKHFDFQQLAVVRRKQAFLLVLLIFLYLCCLLLTLNPELAITVSMNCARTKPKLT